MIGHTAPDRVENLWHSLKNKQTFSLEDGSKG